MFLRKTASEPLPVTMSAVRMGDRVLQIGVDDAAVASALAAKVGLSGYAAIAGLDEGDAGRAQAAAATAGILVDIKVSPLASLPFECDAFDLVIVHGARGLVASLDPADRDAALREWRRLLRRGGRLLAIEAGTVTGLKRLLQQQPGYAAYEAAGGAVGAFETAGFRAVRMLADREGVKFTEGMKP